jgi:hypothetical protein
MAPSPEGVASPHNQVGSSPEGNGTFPFTHAGGNPYTSSTIKLGGLPGYIVPLFPYTSRMYIWKQIVRKRYCKPGTKTDLNIHTILPQGRRSLSVVKTDVMFAPPCRAQHTQKHVFCRTSLSRTARTEARLLSHHGASLLVQKVRPYPGCSIWDPLSPL